VGFWELPNTLFMIWTSTDKRKPNPLREMGRVMAADRTGGGRNCVFLDPVKKTTLSKGSRLKREYNKRASAPPRWLITMKGIRIPSLDGPARTIQMFEEWQGMGLTEPVRPTGVGK